MLIQVDHWCDPERQRRRWLPQQVTCPLPRGGAGMSRWASGFLAWCPYGADGDGHAAFRLSKVNGPLSHWPQIRVRWAPQNPHVPVWPREMVRMPWLMPMQPRSGWTMYTGSVHSSTPMVSPGLVSASSGVKYAVPGLAGRIVYSPVPDGPVGVPVRGISARMPPAAASRRCWGLRVRL